MYRLPFHCDTMFRMRSNRIFLLGVIGSLGIGSIMGLFAVITDGRVNERLIFSAFMIFAFSLISLGASIVRNQNRWRIPMLLAILGAAIGLTFSLFGIWSRSYGYYGWMEFVARGAGDGYASAVTLATAGLLALTRFRSKGLTVVRNFSIILTLFGGGWICTGITFTLHDDLFWRLMWVAVILAIMGIGSTPILYLIWGTRSEKPLESIGMELKLTCPRCLLEQQVRIGESRCSRCRLHFKIDIEEPRCPQCKYLLYQLAEPRCPECGHPLDGGDIGSSIATETTNA